MDIKICARCGKGNNANSKYCAFCGGELYQISQNSQPEFNSSVPNSEISAAVPKPKNKKTIIIIAVCFIIAVIVGITVFILTRPKKEVKSHTVPAPQTETSLTETTDTSQQLNDEGIKIIEGRWLAKKLQHQPMIDFYNDGTLKFSTTDWGDYDGTWKYLGNNKFELTFEKTTGRDYVNYRFNKSKGTAEFVENGHKDGKYRVEPYLNVYIESINTEISFNEDERLKR